MIVTGPSLIEPPESNWYKSNSSKAIGRPSKRIAARNRPSGDTDGAYAGIPLTIRVEAPVLAETRQIPRSLSFIAIGANSHWLSGLQATCWLLAKNSVAPVAIR